MADTKIKAVGLGEQRSTMMTGPSLQTTSAGVTIACCRTSRRLKLSGATTSTMSSMAMRVPWTSRFPQSLIESTLYVMLYYPHFRMQELKPFQDSMLMLAIILVLGRLQR